MNEEIKKKIIIRKIFFSIFSILTAIFLVATVIGGIVGKDDIIPTMALIFGTLCVITLISSIIFGVKFRKLVKEKKYEAPTQ